MSFQFFTSSQNGTISAPGPGGDRAKARGEEKQTSLPVTIRSIENALLAQGEEISFFGSQPELLILVASVESVQKQPNNLDLVVNDGTGRLRVRQYGDAADAQHEGVEVGRYVHMFGQLRPKPEPHFVAQGVRPVKTADEVSYHVIESAHAALKLQRGPSAAPSVQTTPMKVQASPGAELHAPALTPPKAPEPAAAKVPEPAPAPPAATVQSLSGAALRGAMMEFLAKQAEANGDVGCSRSEVCAHFKSSPEAEVSGLLSEMIADGDAITTIDDDHFAVV